jgi:hypothetical protein
MPKAARLVAALAFAALGYLAAEVFKNTMPERTVWGYFNSISAVIGLLCGWGVMGGLVGRGYQAAIGFGLRTMVQAVLLVVIVFSIYEAVLRSTRMRYDGPMEAVLGMFQFTLEYLNKMATQPMVGTLLLGGILGGVAAEWANRRWK